VGRFKVASIRAQKGACIFSTGTSCKRLFDADKCASTGAEDEVTCDGDGGVSTSATGHTGDMVTALSQASTPSFGYVATLFAMPEAIYHMAVSPSGLEVLSHSGSSTLDLIHLETGQGRHLAGSGTACTTGNLLDGPSAEACFGSDLRFAFWGENIVVSDRWNYAIWLVDIAAARTYLIGGNGNQGVSDGAGSDAFFCGPTGVAAIPGGEHVLVVDRNSIRKVAVASGEVTRIGSFFVPGNCDEYDAHHQNNAYSGPCAVSSDGGFAVAAGNNGIIYSISMETGATEILMQSYNLEVSGLVFLRGGSHLLVSDYKNKMLWMHEFQNLSSCIVAGEMGDSGRSDGARGNSSFSNPRALIVLQDGVRALVADSRTLRVVNVSVAGDGGLCNICPCGDTCAPGTGVSCGILPPGAGYSVSGMAPESAGDSGMTPWSAGGSTGSTYFGFMSYGTMVVVMSLMFGATPLCCCGICCGILERKRRRVVRPPAPSCTDLQGKWPPND
jgi:hypothetical protein